MRFKVSSAKWRPFCFGLNGSTDLYQHFVGFLNHKFNVWNTSIKTYVSLNTTIACYLANMWWRMKFILNWIWVEKPYAARCPETFCNYYQVRQTERELRNKDHLDVPWTRTDMGLSSCNIKGARLWNENFPAVNPHLYKKCFKTRVTKYFIEKYVWWSCKILQTPDVSRLYIVQ